MARAARGIRTKLASNASATSLRFRKGRSISATVRLRPTASMLETTKASSATGMILARSSNVPQRLQHGEIFPERLKAVRSTEQGGEDGGVGQEDMSGTFLLRRQPET